MWCKHHTAGRPLLGFLAFILVALTPLYAQQTEKSTGHTALWSTFNAEYYLSKGSFMFFESNLRHYRGNENDNLGNLPFYRFQNMAGYEQRLNAHWAVGVSAKWVIEKGYNSVYSRLYFNHISRIKGVEFLKQAALERIDFSGQADEPHSRFSLLGAFSGNIAIGKSHLRPVISGEVMSFAYWAFRRHPIYENRRIDQTRLRLELAWLFNPRLSVGLFMLRETRYFKALEKTDANGNLIPEHNLNLITPVYGVRVHLMMRHRNLPGEMELRYLPY